MKADALDQSRDLLGCGSALRGRGIHASGFILPWRELYGRKYGEAVLRLSGVSEGVSLGWAGSGVSESFWAKLAGHRQFDLALFYCVLKSLYEAIFVNFPILSQAMA